MYFKLLLFVLCFYSFAFSQEKQNPELKYDSQKQPQKTVIKKERKNAPSELDQFLKTGKINNTQNQNSFNPPEYNLWKPFFFLFFIGIGIFLMVKFLKKRMLNTPEENQIIDFIQPLGSISITPSSKLAVVKIIDKYYLFGVTTSNISMIQEIEDQETVLKLKNTSLKPLKVKNFRNIFSSFLYSKTQKQLDPNINSKQFSEFIQQQKEKLDNLHEK